MRILAVDDEPDILEIVQDELESQGFEVLTASGGFEAFELIKKNEVDFVLTDARMPEGSGLDLLKLIRAHKLDLPVAFLTGFVGTISEEAEKKGAVAVFTKPMNFDEICECIRRYEKKTDK